MAFSVNQCMLLCLSFLCLLFRRDRRRSCRISPIEQITEEMDQLQIQPPPQPLLLPLPQPQPRAIFSNEMGKLVLVKEDEERLEFIVEMVGEGEKYSNANRNKSKGNNAKTGHKGRASAKKSGKLMKKLEMEPLVIVDKEYITFVFNEDEEVDGSRFDPQSGHPIGYDTHGSLFGQGYKDIDKF